eukprot:Cvel_6143.t1-p1 / transcript=Cvel_6143.t1 / gene=Cvel_6143 / organism=Chromera_velia_CCMP2878 / gene_product=hypothetical protein / transcript_product=hypothetical protein / location=Cvel_scaffold297:36312-38287(-) / protein_length=512 / sequence_SO=supercontig / SO=protein_coding / is_pseudo=false
MLDESPIRGQPDVGQVLRWPPREAVVTEEGKGRPETLHPSKRGHLRTRILNAHVGAENQISEDDQYFMSRLSPDLVKPTHTGIGRGGEFQGRVKAQELAGMLGIPPPDPITAACALADGAALSPELPSKVLKHIQALRQEEGAGKPEGNHPLRRNTEQEKIDLYDGKEGSEEAQENARIRSSVISIHGEPTFMEELNDIVASGATGAEHLKNRRDSMVATTARLKHRAHWEKHASRDEAHSTRLAGHHGGTKCTSATDPTLLHVKVFPGPKERKAGHLNVPRELDYSQKMATAKTNRGPRRGSAEPLEGGKGNVQVFMHSLLNQRSRPVTDGVGAAAPGEEGLASGGGGVVVFDKNQVIERGHMMLKRHEIGPPSPAQAMGPMGEERHVFSFTVETNTRPNKGNTVQLSKKPASTGSAPPRGETNANIGIKTGGELVESPVEGMPGPNLGQLPVARPTGVFNRPDPGKTALIKAHSLRDKPSIPSLSSNANADPPIDTVTDAQNANGPSEIN